MAIQQTGSDGVAHRRYLTLGLVFSAYVLASLVTWTLYKNFDTEPAFVFAPQGISTAAFIILGYAAWPAVALASLVASLIHGFPALIVVTRMIANVIEPALTLAFLNMLGFRRSLERTRDIVMLAGTAICTATIVPTVSVFARSVYNTYIGEIPSISWPHLYVGSLLSIIALAPLLIVWSQRPPKASARDWAVSLSTIFALNVLTGIVSYLSAFETHSSLIVISFAIPCFLLLLTIALRFGMHFTSLAVSTSTLVAMSSVILGSRAPNIHGSFGNELLALESAMILGSIFFYILASIEESRKATAAALHEYSRSLRRSLEEKELDAEAKNAFISVLGHEIRNPLAAILSSVELLRINARNEEERERLLEGIEDRVHSMGRLLDDIFDISRITRNKLILKKQTVRACECIKRAAESVEFYMRKNRHHFHMTLPESDVLMHVDPVRIDQILTNLLLNAVKYTPAGGQIELSSSFEGGALSIVVRDSGVGLTEEEQERIFEPFMQINPRQSLMGGVGLGLTLSKNLAEMHGGSISVHSEGPGRGSEFVVRLPAHIGTLRHAKKAPEPVVGDGIKVLVVDDNEDAANAMSRLLRLRGHTAEVAHDGAQALQKAPSGKRDVVLLDIGLPDMDGFEVARRLREAKNPSILIALSGYGQPEHKHKAREAGFDHYLTKPVSVDKVLEIVQSNKGHPQEMTG